MPPPEPDQIGKMGFAALAVGVLWALIAHKIVLPALFIWLGIAAVIAGGILVNISALF